MTTCIIGIDCASQAKDIGVAAADYSEGQAIISGLWAGLYRQPLEDRLAELILSAQRVLIAIDAPLGWPGALADNLANHSAGNALPGEAEQLFTRETDRLVRARTGHRPLEVGANLIARTAKAALDLLERLRHATALPLPLTWSPTLTERASVIEVYPAATLHVHGIPHMGYKRRVDQQIRSTMLTSLHCCFHSPRTAISLLPTPMPWMHWSACLQVWIFWKAVL
jgi:predicted RNase H-like nuclease